MTDQATLALTLSDEAETARLMADLALLIGPGDVITLSGDLGAGKTAAARALIRHLAGDDELEVPSPTFTLVQSYDLPSFPLLHADLYRISDESELEEIGLSPQPDGVVALIEWPERAPGAMPANRIDITLSHGPGMAATARQVVITGHGTGADRVTRLQILRTFLDRAGLADARRERMAGDASTRSYARLYKGEDCVVLMNSPRRPDGPPVHGGKSYSAVVHLAEDVKPFVALANGLRSRGFSTPRILHADLEAGFLIMEDLGSEPVMTGQPPAPILERYRAATEALARLHDLPLPAALPVPGASDYTLPDFDLDAMMIEISLMLDWYLPDREVNLSSRARAEFLQMWRDLIAAKILQHEPSPDALAAKQSTWVLRDYHSPNLIWLEDRVGVRQVGIIDFQDAVIGCPSYDLVSLLQDARIDIPEQLELSMLAHYTRKRLAADPLFDPADFTERYAIMSAQRNTRLLGTFARLNRRDGKPGYLRHQPRVWNYLNRSLRHPALHPFSDWYAKHVPPPMR
ncbi:MAG TPA: tRNA (adenosine(37)-N6)-threonylcarbamoyltransferase complex ATPase subunit type 1 TsaE [Xanthobacteraceae bacterium]|nr:tRNA (adenosine(37)-N6)-threonylcarbamoyltransferase complex ATPase subunit type 1 TsaE [Xanthobacteraceae bacterium]